MAEHKGKPSGKYAETKTSPGRKGDYKRSGWPEDAATQRVGNAAGRQAGQQNQNEKASEAPDAAGRNRKAGSPI